MDGYINGLDREGGRKGGVGGKKEGRMNPTQNILNILYIQRIRRPIYWGKEGRGQTVRATLVT